MKILKPLLLVLSAITIIFSTTFLTTTSCTATPAAASVLTIDVDTDVVAKQRLEKQTMMALTIKFNRLIPKGTVVTKSDIPRVTDLLKYIIESAGYSKSEYILRTWVCPQNHFHTDIKIKLKHWDNLWAKFDGIYAYNNNEI